MDKIPQAPIQYGNLFHKELLNAKNKAQVIDILCSRGSSMGWFSDMPDGLYEKLQALRTVSKPAPEPDTPERQWFRDRGSDQDPDLPDPSLCQVCDE